MFSCRRRWIKWRECFSKKICSIINVNHYSIFIPTIFLKQILKIEILNFSLLQLHALIFLIYTYFQLTPHHSWIYQNKLSYTFIEVVRKIVWKTLIQKITYKVLCFTSNWSSKSTRTNNRFYGLSSIAAKNKILVVSSQWIISWCFISFR